jgi:hypothetical protein
MGVPEVPIDPEDVSEFRRMKEFIILQNRKIDANPNYPNEDADFNANDVYNQIIEYQSIYDVYIENESNPKSLRENARSQLGKINELLYKINQSGYVRNGAHGIKRKSRKMKTKRRRGSRKKTIRRRKPTRNKSSKKRR